MIERSAEVVMRLQRSARAVLDPLILEGADVALIDFPNHSNVGDHMIWLGEIEYLRQRRVRVVYTCDCASYRARDLERVIRSDTTLLLHGGGNFGSLWPRHHAIRLQAMADFPDHRIVQLPQSIQFASEFEAAQTATAIESHKRFVLLVRDYEALQYARARFACLSHLCPDSAFFIGPLANCDAPQFDVVALARSDHEKAFGAGAGVEFSNPGGTLRVVDWVLRSPMDRARVRLVHEALRLTGRFGPGGCSLARPLLDAISRAHMARGKTLLSQGKVVLTDRLHAHILCILLGKTHVMLDNSYRKLSNFHSAWTKDCELTQVARTWREAMDKARALLGPKVQ